MVGHAVGQAVHRCRPRWAAGKQLHDGLGSKGGRPLERAGPLLVELARHLKCSSIKVDEQLLVGVT